MRLQLQVSKLKPDRAMTGKEFRRRVHDVDDATGEATFNQEVVFFLSSSCFDQIDLGSGPLQLVVRWTRRTPIRRRRR